MRSEDRWKDLPDVVAQLQKETSGRPRLQPLPAAPAATRREPAPATQAEEGSWIELSDIGVDEGAGAVEPPPSKREREAAPLRDAPPRQRWGGLADYDPLALDPDPDLQSLGRRLAEETRRLLGARSGTIEPLLEQLIERLDELRASTPEQRAACRTVIVESLDRLEDVMDALLEKR